MTRYFVMERDNANVGNYRRVATRGSRTDAETMCRGHRGRVVWDELKYER